MSWYDIFSQILNMSFTGGIAILAVLLARLLLKRFPKVISYGLWAVVLIRLLCPLAFSSEVSLLGLWDAPAKEAVVGSRIEYISIQGEPMANMPGIDEGLPQESSNNDILVAKGKYTDINSSKINDNRQKNADLNEPTVTVTVEESLDARRLLPLAALWLLGFVLMLLYGSLSEHRLRRKLVGAVCLRDHVFLSDYITSPFVMGVLRPRIYLPSTLGEQEQKYILLHEQHHIRRLDHMVRTLAFLALCIHWFNPLVWAAFILSGKDMEMSCDEAVIRQMGQEIRADYSASLLGLATGRRIIAGMPLSFGEGDPAGRIRNLARWKRPALWAVLVAVAGCGVLAAALLTNPKEKEEESASDRQSLTCNVKSKGIDADVDPTYFPEGTEFSEEGLMRCVVMGNGTLTFCADWDAGELVVGENYYEKHGLDLIIKQETYRLPPDESGKYQLSVSHRHTDQEESVFYFVKGETGKYVLEVQFPAEKKLDKRQNNEENFEITTRDELCYVFTDETGIFTKAVSERLDSTSEFTNDKFFHTFYR